MHTIALAGVGLCLVATRLEWVRARAGHEIAWVYCVEWPLFAAIGIWVWWRLLHETEQVAIVPPTGAEAHSDEETVPDEADLQAWQEYLARLHAVDPPGRTPWEQ